MEFCSLMSEFGSTFKKARESLGISLKAVAIETRIGTRFLQAIEDEEFHILPGGIFNRGFIRNYAQRLGLDPEQAVADYERLSGYQEPTPIESSAPTPQPHSDKPGLSLYPIAVGTLILLILIFYVVTRS